MDASMADRLKVLVVESDQSAAMALADALKKHGVEALVARDAVSSLNVARAVKPDAVVINNQLAGGGGLVALKRIRSNVHTAHLPIIAMVKPPGTQDRKVLSEAGAQACVEQPVDAVELVSTIIKNLLPSLDFSQAPAEILQEPKRLAALKGTALLDSPPDESFDRVASLATRLLGTPTALMSLIDKDRQFFKSQVGLAQPWAAARQTRLSHSFCQWVVSSQEELVIEDAREHPVLRTNLAIKDLGVIAYAGVPLNAGAGQTMGSFCAIDSKPRSWSDDDLATLRDLAQVTEAYAVLKQANAEQPKNAPAAKGKSLEACGSAIKGLTSVLCRHESRLDNAGRADLLGIIKHHGQQLVAFAG
jgi:CheY-like chemotaxis protein